MNKIIKDIKEALNTDNKTKAYDTQAKVIRSEGQTLWVHIPGGVDETPVKKTINAKAGDTVQVRVSGGSAWLVGNQSAPPTDDTTAVEVRNEVKETNAVVKLVKTIAEQAQKIAGNTNQYFWHTQSGTDTGAHITEIPQEDFIDDPQNGGGNLLARSNGIAVRDGLTELAMFGANGAQIGQNANGKTRTEIGSDGMQIMQKNSSGNDIQIANLGYGDSTDSAGSVTTSPYYTLGRRLSTAPAYSSSATYNYGDICEHDGKIYVCKYAISTPEAWNANHWSYSVGSYSVAENRDNVASASESHAEGVYTKAIGLRSHTEGMDTVAIGSESHAEGNGTYAGGLASHAEGRNTKALGEASHASGRHTIANAEYQTVIGKYNTPLGDPTVVESGVPFIIGNGTDENNRSNALTVDWNGKIQTPQMQEGTIATTSVSANSYTDVSVTFPKAMSGTPIVVCSVVSTSTAGAIGSITAAVTRTSTTGFTCRIFNAGSTARTPAVNWIALNI